MGWGDCGTDSKGRGIGYNHVATCDHPGCDKKIDRGLYYACGGMHGDDEVSCERYFCDAHKSHAIVRSDLLTVYVCGECAKAALECGQFHEGDGEIIDIACSAYCESCKTWYEKSTVVDGECVDCRH